MIDQRYRTLLVICGAIVASLAIYTGVAAVVLQQSGGSLGEESLPPLLPAILASVGVTMLLGAGFVSSLILGPARQPGRTVEERLAAYFQSVIVGFAVREGAGVLGLVITLLSGDLKWVLGLSGAAAIAMAVAWPRREKMSDLVNAP